jgi:hypothetical protein
MVWLLRHVKANGKRRTLASLTHGTMANAMPQALGAKKAFPGRQVISLSGDGGLSMGTRPRTRIGPGLPRICVLGKKSGHSDCDASLVNRRVFVHPSRFDRANNS